MDIQPYVDLIIDKFKNAKGYSEIEDEKLSKILYSYLNRIYHEEIEALAIKIDTEHELDVWPDLERYKKETMEIKTKILKKTREIAQTKKEKLPALPDV